MKNIFIQGGASLSPSFFGRELTPSIHLKTLRAAEVSDRNRNMSNTCDTKLSDTNISRRTTSNWQNKKTEISM